MSAEEGSAQPSAAGNDKAPPPKAAATFSSFINKNTTGKKFAPKAARRRPGVAPAAPAPIPPATEPTSLTAKPNAPHPPQGASRSAEPSVATTIESHVQDPVPHATRPHPPPESTTLESQPQQEQETHIDPQLPWNEHSTAPTAEEPEAGKPSKRRRMDDLPSPQGTLTIPEVSTNGGQVQGSAQPIPQGEGAGTPQQPTEQVSVALEAPGSVDPAVDTAGVQSDSEISTTPQSRQRRKLPWVAVNHPRDVEEGEAGEEEEEEEKSTGPAPTKRARQRRKKPTIDGEVEQQGGNEDDEQPVRKRPSAKSRGKRKATMANAEDDAETQLPPKRTRRPRKDKGADGIGSAAVIDGDAEQEAADGDEVVSARKPRQPRWKKRQTTEGEGEGGETGAQPKRKGRPPREPTPSDAEDQTIDPQITFMDGLASRNIRVGKLSNREKQMREIDWEDVKRRRREEDSRPIKSKEEQEAADQALNEAALNAQQELGPRYHVVDGNIELVPNSGTVNREADADREIAEYEIIEDRDITSRVTSRSFMKNNKRFPNDFILPGQGRRWNRDSTDMFYQGLKSFGTDFQMISHMFPGSTRRSIKTKFTREERDDPDRVRQALQGRSEMASHWDVFLEASQRKEESFVDANEIKRQLAEDEARMRELIAAAAEETKQRNLQKAAAGVLDDENGETENGNKENGKSRKKRKDKGKQVTFQEEQGVEIVGSLEDDPTWGQ